jgi:hypothetical protein
MTNQDESKRAAKIAMTERWLSAFLRALPAGIGAEEKLEAGERWIRALEQVEWRREENPESFLRRVTARAMAGLTSRKTENAATV